MISTKPLKDESTKLQEPIKSIIEMSRDAMPEKDFVDFFINLRKKAREIDTKNMEVQK